MTEGTNEKLFSMKTLSYLKPKTGFDYFAYGVCGLVVAGFVTVGFDLGKAKTTPEPSPTKAVTVANDANNNYVDDLVEKSLQDGSCHTYTKNGVNRVSLIVSYKGRFTEEDKSILKCFGGEYKDEMLSELDEIFPEVMYHTVLIELPEKSLEEFYRTQGERVIDIEPNYRVSGN